MTSNVDSRNIYTLCISQDLSEVHRGFQQLGEFLMPVARAKLNLRFDNGVVEECVQESLVAIWQNLEKGNGPNSPDSLLGWAVTITQRKCIDRVRYEGRRQTEELKGNAGDQDDENLPETCVEMDEGTVSLLLSINSHGKLSEKSKAILVQGILFNKSDTELAQELAATNGNIRLTRHRNLEKLRTDNDFMTGLLT